MWNLNFRLFLISQIAFVDLTAHQILMDLL